MNFEDPLTVTLHFAHSWYLVAIFLAAYLFLGPRISGWIDEVFIEKAWIHIKKGLPQVFPNPEQLNERLRGVSKRYHIQEFTLKADEEYEDLFDGMVCLSAEGVPEISVPPESLQRITIPDVFVIAHEMGHIKAMPFSKQAFWVMYNALLVGTALLILPFLTFLAPSQAHHLIPSALRILVICCLLMLSLEILADYWALRFLFSLHLVNRNNFLIILIFAGYGLLSYIFCGYSEMLILFFKIVYKMSVALFRTGSSAAGLKQNSGRKDKL